jgi:hypothetical protein
MNRSLTAKNPTPNSSSLPVGSVPSPQIVHQLADIGQMVRMQRKSQGLRIDDAAAFAGVSVDLLSRLENGKGTVGLDKVLAVLDQMGLCLVVAPRNHPLRQALVHADSTSESATKA